jgi:hypothetical protein
MTAADDDDAVLNAAMETGEGYRTDAFECCGSGAFGPVGEPCKTAFAKAIR